MPVICGLDPSLTSTGVCVYNPSDENGVSISHVAQISGIHKDCHVGERCERIARQVINEICSSGVIDACETIEVFIEEPGGMLQGTAQDLRTLFWAIVRHIEAEKFIYPTIYSVAPATLKKMLTGRGNCKPEDKAYAVLTKLKHMIPEKYVVSDETKGGIMKFKDAFDGIGLAALGECYLGGGDYTKMQRESVAKVKKL